MNTLDILEKKKRGEELSYAELEHIIKGYVDGNVPDYQVSAFLMAVNLKGMTERETFNLTEIMLNSGENTGLSGKGYFDKHSTGGVGDSTTLIVLPVLASLGYKCWKMSGGALGFTGGTLDKLASVGARTDLSAEQTASVIERYGMAIVGQTKNICPADKKLYALRDVTATVDSIPLIASSIMSKKLAGGADNIVLDVKCGSGAFMKAEESATALAEEMCKIGKNAGKNVVAVVTDMNEPLSSYVGNRLEIYGVLEVLSGAKNKLYEVARELTVTLLASVGQDVESAELSFDEAISSGRARERLLDVLRAQGTTDDDLDNLLHAGRVAEVRACESGYVTAVDTEAVGRAVCLLGAGREKLGDEIDYEAGVIWKKRIGDEVQAGDTLFIAHFNKDNVDSALEMLSGAVKITDKKPEESPSVKKILR